MQLLKWSFQLPGTTSTCANSPTHMFLEQYRYCMKSTLPDTEILIFNKNKDDALDWANMRDNYEGYKENAPKEIITYQSACSGDSGSGQFVTNNINPDKLKDSLDELRYVLVAIYFGGFGNSVKRNVKDVKEYKFPCGSYTWVNGKYEHNNPTSESTTWSENLLWIKKKANICKDSSCKIS